MSVKPIDPIATDCYPPQFDKIKVGGCGPETTRHNDLECLKGGPAPDWTKEPPTEPGLWFWRIPGNPPSRAHISELEKIGSDLYDTDSGEGVDFFQNREWWPVPIPEPPR